MSDDGAPAPTGSGEIADRRAEFARRSRTDGQSTRGFVEHKIEIVRGDPILSEAEKDAAIAELRRALGDVAP
ncbi:MAG TPA: hypothetical protein VIW24_02690 [Aldersonia sp.]